MCCVRYVPVLLFLAVPLFAQGQTVGMQVQGYVYSSHLLTFPKSDSGWQTNPVQFQFDDEGTNANDVTTGIHFGATGDFQRLTTSASGFARNNDMAGAVAGIGSLIGGAPTAQSFDRITVGGSVSGLISIPIDLLFSASTTSTEGHFTEGIVSSRFHLDGSGVDSYLDAYAGSGFGDVPALHSNGGHGVIKVHAGDTLRLFHFLYTRGYADANGGAGTGLTNANFSFSATSDIRFHAPAGVSLLGESGHEYAQAVPEPASLFALCLGLVGLSRRKKKSGTRL